MRTELELLLIGLGGALGAISRYAIAEVTKKAFAGTFPLGTLIANLAGCFMIGLIFGSGHVNSSHPVRLGFGVGFLGALTTFSTFGVETVNHLNDGRWPIAFFNVVISVGLGLVFVFAGMIAGRKLVDS